MSHYKRWEKHWILKVRLRYKQKFELSEFDNTVRQYCTNTTTFQFTLNWRFIVTYGLEKMCHNKTVFSQSRSCPYILVPSVLFSELLENRTFSITGAHTTVELILTSM